MSGIVFQELREARALAYGAGAHYVPGGRKGEQNLMVGYISCQADKTVEAVVAFLDLLDRMPRSEARFQESVDAMLSRYRTAKLGFREVLSAVRTWERLGVPIDPRKERFEKIPKANLQTLFQFHQAHVA